MVYLWNHANCWLDHEMDMLAYIILEMLLRCSYLWNWWVCWVSTGMGGAR